MSNRDLQAAWHYHNGTKHPNGDLFDPLHQYDPGANPLPFKIYSDLEPISLPHESTASGVSALSAIAAQDGTAGGEHRPNLGALAKLLYFSAGITKRIRYPGGYDFLFRAAACTGALYHIEIYVVCGTLPDLEAGVYHFSPHDFALRRLRSGDYRRVLAEATGNDTNIAQAPAVLVYSDVFWRNAVKYDARAYRHAFWDSGTLLSHTLAIAAAQHCPAKLVMGFVDAAVNQLLDLDTEHEAALALVSIGQDSKPLPDSAPDVLPLNLRVEPISDDERVIPAIRDMHAASSLSDASEVTAWRAAVLSTRTTAASGQLVRLQLPDPLPTDSVEDVILRRGSTRRFTRESITFQQLSILLETSTHGLAADFGSAQGTPPTLNTIYLIVNAVDGLSAGSYVLHREARALELLKPGDFRQQAGVLALQQALAADASVNIYFLADLNPILERLGNRGYRAAQLDASITAGKMYLAAYAQGIGASGLTFYDDLVSHFFSPSAQDQSVMFLIAVGKKARRRS